MKFKKSVLVALILTVVTGLLFVAASPIVPLGDQMPWLMISVVAAAVTAVSWIVAIQSRGPEEEESKTL